MKVRKTPPATALDGITTMLRLYVPELTSGDVLLEALKRYDTSGGAKVRERRAAGKLLSVPAFAERCGCSERKVWELLRAKRLPRVKLGTRTTRIPEAALAQLIEGASHE